MKTDIERLLNDGLHLAMAWGADWLMPIQDRLAQQYPYLPQSEQDEINAICQSAMRFGHHSVYELAEEQDWTIRYDRFDAIVRTKYPWVSADNMSRLFNQSMYYAMK